MSRLRVAVPALLLIVSGGELASGQSLRGSRSSVNRSYNRAVRNDLEFMKTSTGVYEAVKRGGLVTIGITGDLLIDRVEYPFVLATTREVVYAFAGRYHASCGERLMVTSAVRPRVEQPRNASRKSVHPTGMAVDFRRPGGRCLTFMRKELIALEKQGVVEATEERHPVHFHVVALQLALAPPAVGGAATKTAEDQAATYAVRPGDSLSEIAKRFGTSVAKLKSLNNLRGSTLQPGQKLRVN